MPVKSTIRGLDPVGAERWLVIHEKATFELNFRYQILSEPAENDDTFLALTKMLLTPVTQENSRDWGLGKGDGVFLIIAVLSTVAFLIGAAFGLVWWLK